MKNNKPRLLITSNTRGNILLISLCWSKNEKSEVGELVVSEIKTKDASSKFEVIDKDFWLKNGFFSIKLL